MAGQPNHSADLPSHKEGSSMSAILAQTTSIRLRQISIYRILDSGTANAAGPKAGGTNVG